MAYPLSLIEHLFAIVGIPAREWREPQTICLGPRDGDIRRGVAPVPPFPSNRCGQQPRFHLAA